MKPILIDTILACLKAQGLTVVRIADTTYGSPELDAAFAADVANNAAMAIPPIAATLSARLACIQHDIEGAAPWFRADRVPDAEREIRDWAAEHADSVYTEDRGVGLCVTHRRTFCQVVTLYSTMDDEPAREPRVCLEDEDAKQWRPGDRTVQP